MTGWEISLYRLPDDVPTEPEQLKRLVDHWRLVGKGSLRETHAGRLTNGPALTSWRARASGLSWPDSLVAASRAVGPVGDGYPYIYFVRACDVAEVLLEHGGPPEEKLPLRTLNGVSTWGPRTKSVLEVCTRVQPSEWLLLEAWDES